MRDDMRGIVGLGPGPRLLEKAVVMIQKRRRIAGMMSREIIWSSVVRRLLARLGASGHLDQTPGIAPNFQCQRGRNIVD